MKYPSFPFYPNDWLSAPEIMIMTPAEEGAYIRLLALCWTGDGLPDDDDQLAVLSRLGKGWNKSKDRLRACFTKMGDRLQHKRLLEEREKYEQFREKQRTNGQRGGRPKKTVNEQSKESDKKGLGFSGLSETEPKKSFSLSLSSSLSNSDSGGANTPPAQPQSGGNAKKRKSGKQPFIRPSESEVLLYFSELMTGNWTPERIQQQSAKWYNHYSANGWRVGRNPMKDWKAAVRNWTSNDFDNPKIEHNAAPANDTTTWERNKQRTRDLENQ